MLHTAYTELGYTHCETDWSVYTCQTSSTFSMSATSMDDILITSDSKAESDRAMSEINLKFTITDSGDAEWILGCRITCDHSKCLLMIDQEQFVTTILQQFGMEHCNPVAMPLPNTHLTSNMCPRNLMKNVQLSLHYHIAPLLGSACIYQLVPVPTSCMQSVNSLVSCPILDNIISTQQNIYSAIFRALVRTVSSTVTPPCPYLSSGHSQILTGPCLKPASQFQGTSLIAAVVPFLGVPNNKPLLHCPPAKQSTSLACTVHATSSGFVCYSMNLVFPRHNQVSYIATIRALSLAHTTLTHILT